MNPQFLLAHFNRVSDAPDAIPRLRRFILDLAMRGQLVAQDPNDDPASELLREMQAEKHRLAKPKSRVADDALSAISPNEIPYKLPHGWEWARLGLLGDTNIGLTYSPQDVSDHGVPVLRSNNIREGKLVLSDLVRVNTEVKQSCLVNEGDLLICARNGSRALVGKAAIIPALRERTAFGAFMAIFRSRLNGYIYQFICSPLFRLMIDEVNTNTINQLTQANLRSTLAPIPPLAEQHRIVAKVDELMTLCDRLDIVKAERENRRDRLSAASHHHLNSGAGAEDFRTHAHFHLNHFHRITTRAEQIKQLRQTIRNLAIRGQLVPQERNDEPASELLRQIEADKARLIKCGEIKKQKPLQTVEASATPFPLPNGWIWTRLGELSSLVTSGSRDWAKYYSNDGALFVRMGNLSRDSYQLRLEHIQRVIPPLDSEGARTKLEAGDILISITGEVGLLGLIPQNFGEAYINQHTCLVRPMERLRGRFLPELFCSPFAQRQFDEPQRGLKNSFRLTDVTNFLVPLPPLAEQHRILAKLDELMGICDRLEANLTLTQSKSRFFLEAVLHGALAATAEEPVTRCATLVN